MRSIEIGTIGILTKNPLIEINQFISIIIGINTADQIKTSTNIKNKTLFNIARRL